MRLHVLSDLHLEFSNHIPPAVTDDADVIVLAGDICTKDNGIHWARATWPDKEIVYVAGNHEHYRHDISENTSLLRATAKESGVHFLENDEVVIGGVRFLGACLWTNFQLFGLEQKQICMIDAKRALNDFRLIRNGNRLFSPQDSIVLHDDSVKWLEMKLKCEPFDGPTVVVTHHCPSWESVAERFRIDLLSACFASQLNHLIGFSELWIHGHTHDSFDYKAAGTRVVCNPRGYQLDSGDQENKDFKPDLIIEVAE